MAHLGGTSDGHGAGAFEIERLADAEALATEAARRFVAAAQQAVATDGRFTVALAGGSTPVNLYHLLARPPHRDAIDWQHTLVFFGDERCVPEDDRDSNYRTAREALLDQAPVPAANVFPICCPGTPEEAAAVYTQTLAVAFGVPGRCAPPVRPDPAGHGRGRPYRLALSGHAGPGRKARHGSRQRCAALRPPTGAPGDPDPAGAERRATGDFSGQRRCQGQGGRGRLYHPCGGRAPAGAPGAAGHGPAGLAPGRRRGRRATQTAISSS